MFKSFSIHASVKKLRKKIALLNKVICKMLEWSVSNAVNQIIGNEDEKRIMTDLIPRADWLGWLVVVRFPPTKVICWYIILKPSFKIYSASFKISLPPKQLLCCDKDVPINVLVLIEGDCLWRFLFFVDLMILKRWRAPTVFLLGIFEWLITLLTLSNLYFLLCSTTKNKNLIETGERYSETHAAKPHLLHPKIHRDILLMWPQTQSITQYSQHHEDVTGVTESSCPGPNFMKIRECHRITQTGRDPQGSPSPVAALQLHLQIEKLWSFQQSPPLSILFQRLPLSSCLPLQLLLAWIWQGFGPGNTNTHTAATARPSFRSYFRVWAQPLALFSVTIRTVNLNHVC